MLRGVDGVRVILAPELREYARQVRAQTAEIRALFGGHDEAALYWRPDPTQWSIAQHVSHLTLATRSWLSAIDAAVERTRAGGFTGPGPYRHGWLGNLVVRMMEPAVPGGRGAGSGGAGAGGGGARGLPRGATRAGTIHREGERGGSGPAAGAAPVRERHPSHRRTDLPTDPRTQSAAPLAHLAARAGAGVPGSGARGWARRGRLRAGRVDPGPARIQAVREAGATVFGRTIGRVQ